MKLKVFNRPPFTQFLSYKAHLYIKIDGNTPLEKASGCKSARKAHNLLNNSQPRYPSSPVPILNRINPKQPFFALSFKGWSQQHFWSVILALQLHLSALNSDYMPKTSSRAQFFSTSWRTCNGSLGVLWHFKVAANGPKGSPKGPRSAFIAQKLIYLPPSLDFMILSHQFGAETAVAHSIPFELTSKLNWKWFLTFAKGS